jgi:hypothetical protein
MWRAFFLAVGFYSALLGVECLALEKVTVSVKGRKPAAQMAVSAAPALKEVTPPEWAPWSLMSGGAVVVLYSFTIPKRVKG